MFAGYLFSCIALLIVTAIVMAPPSLALSLLHFDNVIVKNAATQSGEFVTCMVVVQNVVGSLFNSHLFDFVQGWVYVIGVGVAGGTVLNGTRINAPARIGGGCWRCQNGFGIFRDAAKKPQQILTRTNQRLKSQVNRLRPRH